MDFETILDYSLRFALSMICGILLGVERKSRQNAVGIRTLVLISISCCLLSILSVHLAQMGVIKGDPTRIASTAVTGIGFIGGGAILKQGLNIRGLTTAASLWMVSAIGLAVGSGMFFLSAMATAITMVTLVTFHTWEKRFASNSRSDRRFVRITTSNRNGAITDITGYLTLNGIQVKSLNVKKNKDKDSLIIDLYLKVGKSVDGADYVRGLQSIEGVISVENSKY